MSEQHDQTWLDALAGKPVTGGDPATVQEAIAVRQALLARAAQEFDAESGQQRLLFRLRQEKLIGEGQARRSWRLYAGVAVAASLALVIGIMTLQEPPTSTQTDGFVTRGGPGAPQVLTSADPAKLASELSADLDNIGLKPSITEFGASTTIEADWPQTPDAKHREFLQRYRLAPPDGARLRIEVRASAK